MSGRFPISQLVKDTVRRRIISAFNDLPFFEALVLHKIDRIIDDLHNFDDIDKKTTKVLIERYFEEDKFKSFGEGGERLLAQIKIIVTSLYVLFAYYDPRNQHYIWRSEDDLKRMYPQFNDLDVEELKLLLNFRNIVRIALLIVPAQKNKKFLLDIGGRLEGRTVYSEYITGSGQKDSVKKRLIIYYSEARLDSTEADALYRLTFSRTSRPANGTTARDKPNANKKKIDELTMTPELIQQLGSYPPDPVIETIVPQSGLLTRPDPLLNAKERVINTINVMKRAFSDMWHFDLLMPLPLRCMIEQQLELIDIGTCSQAEFVFVKEEDILRATYRYDLFQRSKELKKVWEKMRFVMTACKLFLLSDTPAAKLHKITLTQLWELYPEFNTEDIDGLEAEYLLRFRNFMKLGCLVVPGCPKIFLLRVVERLEGADNQYITGKGQTDATDRRVAIYDRESGTDNASNGASSMAPLTAANLAAVNGAYPAEEASSADLPIAKRQRTDNKNNNNSSSNSHLHSTHMYNSNNSSSSMYPPMMPHLPRELSMSQWMTARQESFRNWRQGNDQTPISPDVFERKFSEAPAVPSHTSGSQQFASSMSMLPPANVIVVNPLLEHFFTESCIPFTNESSFMAAAATAEVDETVARDFTDAYIDEEEPSIVDEVTNEVLSAAPAASAEEETHQQDTADHGFDLNSVFSTSMKAPLAVLSRQRSRQVSESIFRRHQLQHHQPQPWTGMSRQSSLGNPEDDLDALPPLNVPLQRESSMVSTSGLLYTEGSWLDQLAHGPENDRSSASVVAAINAVGGSAPPPLSIEKEFSTVPLSLHFQPLFALPKKKNAAVSLGQVSANATEETAPAGETEADALEAAAEMMDSVEVFQEPFTETLFGYFVYTDGLLPPQLDDAIDQYENLNQTREG